jgi:dTMP kinase
MSGLFIALEGLDGSGTTTQIARLVDALPGAHRTAEPSTGPVGRLIRRALGGEEPLGDGVLPYLFAADRKDHLEREIEPRLARDQVVITDRYYASSLAYQSLAAPLDFILGLNARFRAPDLTLFIDLAPEACLERIEARHRASGQPLERFETLEQLQEIAAAYGMALAVLASRGERIATVSGEGGPDEVAARVLDAVRAFAPARVPEEPSGSPG